MKKRTYLSPLAELRHVQPVDLLTASNGGSGGKAMEGDFAAFFPDLSDLNL